MSDLLRILLVDDDETDRGTIRRALAEGDLPATVVEAARGEDALALLRDADRAVDCVLMDYALPDRDGVTFLREIRAIRPNMPIIVVTASGSERVAVELMKAGAADYLSKGQVSMESLSRSVGNAVRVHRAENAAARALDELQEQTRIAQTLNRIGARLVSERDLQRLVQLVTDETTAITGANFGAFFYNVLNRDGERYMLYTLSGAPREAFGQFPMPRNTEIFSATFSGTGTVRLDDVTADPRYGHNAPFSGMPPGHLPVRSYLAAPVVGRSGDVIGGLFFGHERAGVFTDRDERVLEAIASQAAIAIDSARLYDALRRGEEQYRFLAEAIPQIVWTARPDGSLDYLNSGWTHYSGQSVEAGCGAGWQGAVHAGDLAATGARWKHSLATGEPYEHQFRLRRADGTYRWHLVRALPMRDETGAIIRWFGTCTDLHDLRHTEEALKLHRERLDLVLDASELGLWYCDLPFDELEWNVKCKEHFHLPPDAAVTMDLFYERIHPDDREFTRKAVEAALENRTQYDIVYRTVAPPASPTPGKTNWIRAIGRGFYDAAGVATRFDGITVDVTAPKEAEQALVQAKEAAEAANVAKDRFLAVLSHELRTPLMPVLTTVQSLDLEPHLRRDVREALGVIRRNIELEARLIDDLLDLTRISKGKLQLNFETVDLHQVVRSAMDICAADMVAKNLGSTLDLSAPKHHVRGDPARLQQVFWNLIKNAIKFTPPQGHITIHSYADPSGAVKIHVTDTGVGIEAHSLPRIFDAFEQGSNHGGARGGGGGGGGGGSGAAQGGLGLGLAISKALIDLHGGKLAADSAGPGHGATFTIALRPTAPAAEAPAVGVTPRARPASARGIRILLVDDHRDTNRAMARLLERMGYAVQTADSVKTALDAVLGAAHETPFDLLISDIGLPDGSGLELMRELLQRHPIKGIALSGFGMEEDVKRSKDAGFYEHLTKPINFKRLETAIIELTSAELESR